MSSQWNLHNPGVLAAISEITRGGGDASALIEAAKANTPTFAPGRPGSMPVNSVTGAASGPSIPDNGRYSVPDGKGGYIDVAVPNAAANAADYQSQVAAAEAAAKAGVELRTAGPIQYAKTSGEKGAAAPYEVVEIPNGDGTSTKGVLRVVNGATTFTPIVAGAGAANGQSGGAGFNQSQSPGNKEFSTAQATQLSNHVSQLASAREGALQTRLGALQTQGFALSHPMNPATPNFVAGANFLRAVAPDVLTAAGIDPNKINDLSTDAATFNRVTNQNVLGLGKTLLPSRYTERELALTKPIAGTLTTPNDAMMFSAAMMAAGNQRLINQADFATQYAANPNTVKTDAALAQAWANSPQGKQSLFQDPQAWGHVTIHGKPAVVYTPDGKWGAFMLGTPYAYKFQVQ